ncbi:MAG TPA: KTSC domain-containing protein [Spirochaetota bacterium]|nr:KTSC domain-containing protein [Spirochaetota bacterium]HRR60413.1 KTSC domain-containing protein [Spirochaetota bacterium]
MERQYVESTLITSMGYDSTSAILEVEFKSNGAIWQYYDVSENVYLECLSSGSVGKYFLRNINGQYAENKVG